VKLLLDTFLPDHWSQAFLGAVGLTSLH